MTKPILKKKQILLKNKILETTLRLGKNPGFTNKKLTQYLYGTKNNIELFRISELQYILLRTYPFIENLFKNYRLNYTSVKKSLQKKK